MLIYPCRICYLPYHDFLIAKDAQGICIVLLGHSKGCLIGGPVITGFALGFRHTLIFLQIGETKNARYRHKIGKMKCGTDESVISFESNILEISKKNRIEYEYSVASNMIRILKTERYLDVLPGHGVIPWPWLQRIDLLLF